MPGGPAVGVGFVVGLFFRGLMGFRLLVRGARSGDAGLFCVLMARPPARAAAADWAFASLHPVALSISTR